MRRAQVYRWQIPMDAGVVLRERRLKTRDGLFVYLRDGERDGWGEVSPLPGFSHETLDDAQLRARGFGGGHLSRPRRRRARGRRRRGRR